MLSDETVALLGIGQGPVAATPLQVAQGFAMLAGDGRAFRPHVAEGEGEIANVLRLSERTRAAVMDGLARVVSAPRGTAHGAFHAPFAPGDRSFAGEFPEVRVAGKTATAERGGGPPHAWFAGVASNDEPELAFAVIVEGGGLGGAIAAPAAARMLRAYYRLKGTSPGPASPLPAATLGQPDAEE
jgi:cell division protein FtsI/penicillin-binding protein 2